MSIFGSKKRVPPPHPRPAPKYAEALSAAALKQVFSGCADYELREVFPGLAKGSTVTVCWLDGVVSGGDVSKNILRPLTESRRFGEIKTLAACLELAEAGGIYSYSVEKRETLDEVVHDLTQGWCAVVFDGEGAALSFEVRTTNQRAVSEPTVEKSVKGAKDAFIETLRINTSLVRRKLRSPELKLIQTTVGRKSGTTVAIMYVDRVADPAIVDELRRRLDDIDIDGLLAAGDLDEYIVDDPNTPFPQLIHTERADKFAMALLDGCVGLLADGLPIGFLLPATLSAFMRVPEDEALHFTVASALKMLRGLAFVFTLILPALMVAVAMYHQEMIPTKLLLSMIEAKKDVPFGVALEVLSMLVAFELLQEAGLRLPTPVGQTVSIIGALIVGQSAVEARVVSPVAVIVVALAGIAGYTMPSQDVAAALRLCRFTLTLLAALAGLYGLVAGLAMLVWHLGCVESYGLAYTSPVTDGGGGFMRTLVRRPLRKEKLRNRKMNGGDLRRQR